MCGVNDFGSISELMMTIYTSIGPFYGKFNRENNEQPWDVGCSIFRPKKLGWPDWYMLANFTPNRPQACFSQNDTCLRHPIDGDLIFSFSWLWRKQTNWLIDGGMMKELLSEQNHLQRLLWPRGSWWMCDYVNLAINGWNIGHQKSCCGPVLSGCVSKWSIYLKYLSIEYA